MFATEFESPFLSLCMPYFTYLRQTVHHLAIGAKKRVPVLFTFYKKCMAAEVLF
jgi:hypothetical protein